MFIANKEWGIILHCTHWKVMHFAHFLSGFLSCAICKLLKLKTEIAVVPTIWRTGV